MDPKLEQPNTGVESAVSFQLPLEGLSYILWGGEDELHNYHAAYDFNAWAYDFLVWVDGGTCALPCEALEDYHIFGRPLLAPAAGEVVNVRSDQPDLTPGEMDPMHPTGNHLVIKVSEGEFLLLGHMREGSATVAVGDHVEAGQVIGAVGNSGNTTEPHLHIQLQNVPTYGSQTVGRPLWFEDVLVDGEPVAHAMPVGGSFVSPQ